MKLIYWLVQKNLLYRYIQILKKMFRCTVGLSDHSIGITSCLGAYMLGVRIFEKHFTSSKDWDGESHWICPKKSHKKIDDYLLFLQ